MATTSREGRLTSALAAVVTLLLLAASTAAPANGAEPAPSYADEWAFGTATDDVTGVAVSGDQVFVVGEVATMRRYTAGGKLTATWQLGYAPSSIAAGPDGLLHVTQSWNPGRPTSWVHVYDRNGRLVRQYTLGEGVTWFPGDIGIDGAGNAYVTDTHDGTAGIHRFGADGSWTGSIQSAFGLALDEVEGIGVAPDGTFYAADTGNHRIVRFGADGRSSQWGQSGLGNGQFMAPWGVAVAPDGNVLVIDAFSNRLQEMTPAGVFVRQLGRGRLRENSAVAITPRGTVYVGGYLASLTRGVARLVPPGLSGGAAGVVLPAKKVKVRTKQRRAVVQIRCQAAAPCRGKVQVKRGGQTLAKGSYRVGKGKKKAVKVKLTAVGLKVSRNRPKAKVKVVLRTSHGLRVTRAARLRR